ncbi:MAG: ABC transporter substrate-binding protein [Chloroflexota bacterium]|nr:ABC transporter substrate-binding protein [Chloroflexota bacterium]
MKSRRTRNPMARSLNRRAFAGTSAALAASLPLMRAGAQDATPAASPAANAEEELEIFSWWTTAGEADGLQQLFDAFSANYPDVEIVNAAVAGGAGSNAQVALQTRLSGGQPPDSWQSHTAQELYSLYVDPGYCEPVTALWESEGWMDAYPQALIDQVTRDGDQWLVPVGVHRGNVMFYNRQVFEDNGIDVGEEMSVDQFLEAAVTLDEAGIAALGLGSQDTFSTPQLFENILLAHLGPEAYMGLWDFSTDWSSAEVTEAIEILSQMLQYVNDDHPSLTWDAAMDQVIEGTSATTVMGDWAWGHVVANGAEDQIGYVAHPGSAGSFVAVTDGFTMPVDPPHPVNAENWLITAGSADAQTAFAPFKGAIPARTDVDTSEFNEYMQWAAAAFAEDAIVTSVGHGAATTPQHRQSIFDATISFLGGGDAEIYQEDLVFAAEDAQANM